MPDQIRYDLLTQQALRGVVRSVLTEAAKKGLPGEHHFFISFDTHGDGVRISERLRAQYPKEMTIILQHQFWDLTVNEQGFEVGLSFGGITERLSVPFEAINGFFDPSVQFGLQFEEVTEGEAKRAPANAQIASAKDGNAKVAHAKDKPAKDLPAKDLPAKDLPAKPRRVPASPPAVVASETPPAATSVPEVKPGRPTSGGGEVVRLDRFRKK